MGKGFDKFLNMIRLNDEDYDDYDDYDDFEMTTMMILKIYRHR